MKSLQKSIFIMTFFLSGCALTDIKTEDSVKVSTDITTDQKAGERELYEFSFGGLLLYIPERGEDYITCGDKITEYVEKEYRCQEFQVDGKTFFEGVYRKVKGEIAEGGIFEDATEPKLILDTRYFKRITMNDKTFILAIEYDYHDTLSVLYQLSVVNGKSSLRKIHTYLDNFYDVHEIPGGVIYVGYDINTLAPWAIYFDGEEVQELEFLGEPDEIILWNPDDGPQEKTEDKIRY